MLDDSARTVLASTRFADVRWYPEVESTNQVGADLARRRAVHGAVVIGADHQTAGRGRLGRRWEAPPGSSLLLSVVWQPALAAPVHLLTTALALAAVSACAHVAGVEPRLKWPNDLVVGDQGAERKLGGVLGEVVRESGEVGVVVGLGLNVNWDEPPPPPGVALNQLIGRAVDRAELLVAFLLGLDELHDLLATPDGPRHLLDQYRTRSATLGRRVRVDLSAGGVEGEAVAITHEGHLLVRPADGRPHVVTAGDVVHVRPA